MIKVVHCIWKNRRECFLNIFITFQKSKYHIILNEAKKKIMHIAMSSLGQPTSNSPLKMISGTLLETPTHFSPIPYLPL